MSISRIDQLTPLLRFSEFHGEWTPIKIKKVIKEKKIISNENLPLYSLTIEDGITAKTDRYEREFLVKNRKDAYKVMEQNDFAYNPMNLRYGALGRHKGPITVKVSKYYDIFSSAEDVEPTFLEYLLKNYASIKYYNRMAEGSLIEKKRVHFTNFLNFTFPFPSKKEQKKIADFLDSVKYAREKLIRKAELLKTYKHCLMQKIFSKELRFKKDDGSMFPEWEKKKLSEIATINSGGTPDTSISSYWGGEV